MARRDPFAHLERLYAEALLRHHDRFIEPPTPLRRPRSRRRLVILLLPYLLLLAAAGAVLARELYLASLILASITLLTPLLLLARSIRPIGRRLDLDPPTVGSAGVELLLSGLLLLALTVLPALLAPLGVAFFLRMFYLARHRIRTATDQATVRLELTRLRAGVAPRIYGLVDERHGGDARRLAHYGVEVAELRAATR